MAILKADLRQRIFNYTHHLRGLKNDVNEFYFINQHYPERYQAEYREVLDKAKIKRKNKRLPDNQKVKVAIKRNLCVNVIPQKNPIHPPTVKELMKIEKKEMDKIEDMNFGISESIKEKGSTFVGYAVKTASVIGVRRAHNKTHTS